MMFEMAWGTRIDQRRVAAAAAAAAASYGGNPATPPSECIYNNQVIDLISLALSLFLSLSLSLSSQFAERNVLNMLAHLSYPFAEHNFQNK